jgi:small conductance mechanosensitive channel
MDKFMTQVLDFAVALLPNLAIALVILLASLYFGQLLGRLTRTALLKRQTSAGVAHLLSQTVRWTIVTFGVISALQRFFDVTAFLAGLGILGFTVGFALQDVMKNFAAGIILLIQRPFGEGDAISVADFDGTVLAINLRTTELKTFDGRIVILPNADVLAHAIVNYTRADRRRVNLPIRAAYGSDPETIRRLVLEVCLTVAGFVNDPAPLVVFHTFNASSIDLTAYFWIDTKVSNPDAARDAALTGVKAAFEAQGVEIPYPIQTVLLNEK